MPNKRSLKGNGNNATNKYWLKLRMYGRKVEIGSTLCMLIFSGDYLLYMGTKGGEMQPGLGLLITMTLTTIPPKWSQITSCILRESVLSKIFTKNEYEDVSEQLEQKENESDVKRSNNPSQSPQECTKEGEVGVESAEEWDNRLNCYLFMLLDTFSQVDGFELSSILRYSVGEFRTNDIYSGYFFKNNRMIETGKVKKDGVLSQGSLIMKDKSYSGYLKGEIPHSFGTVKSSLVNYCGIMNNGSQSFGSYSYDRGGGITTTWRNLKVGRFALELSTEGIYYYGFMVNGKKTGYGVAMLLNGNVVIGNWQDNQVQGMIISLTHRGALYWGDSTNHQFCGRGIMFYRNRSVYNGEWDGNQYHGTGTIYLHRQNEILMKKCRWDHGQAVETYRSGKYVVHIGNSGSLPSGNLNNRASISPQTDYSTDTLNPNASDNDVSESGDY